MIIRVGGRVYEIKRAGITHKAFQSALQLSMLQEQLLGVKQLIISESAKGPSLELRRLREKAKRLEKRIANTKP